MPRFTLHSRRENGDHLFDAYDCEAADRDLVAELAEAVRELYVDQAGLRDRMLEAANAVSDIADINEISAAVEAVTRASVPEAGVRLAQPQLDMARNELGEILAYLVLEGPCGAVVPAKRVREKEVPQLPSRGLDALALVDADVLTLLISEVKTSDEDASPPRVVGQGDTSLHSQVLNILGDSDRVLIELNWAFKHCGEADEPLVARAMLLHTRGELVIAAVPVLVRPERCHADTDCGIFESDPDSLAPAAINFCVVRLAQEIDDLALAVYQLAREAA